MGRGAGIRVRGEHSLQIDFVWKGTRYRPRLRLPPTKANVEHAKRLKATIEHEIAIGTFDLAKRFPRLAAVMTPGTPLDKAMEVYLDSLHAELEPETLQKYKRDALIVAAWFGPGATIESLTRARVRDVIGALQLSKKRILNLLTPLRGALSQATDDGILANNPLVEFRIRRTRRTDDERPRPFTPAEVVALAQQRHGDLWHIWAWTGLRSGEIIGLRPGDIELDARKLHVRRAVRVGREKAPKTSTGERVVAILSPVCEPLQRALSGAGDWLFVNPNTGQRWHEDRGLARAFRADCKAAGVPYRPPKHLRHTYASWALSAGENPMWVAKQMGHRDTTMIFRVYGQWIPDLDTGAGSRMLAKAH